MDLLHEIRLAARRLLREPIFTATALVTLAVGIGANSAIFTLVNGVLLSPLPFSEPSSLVMPHAIVRGEPLTIFSRPVYVALRDRAESFEDVALSSNTGATFVDGVEPEFYTGGSITTNYFEVAGIAPLHGRNFRPDEREEGSSPTLLLSEGLWRERYGADPTVVGRTIEVNGVRREVVGIMPAHASFPLAWRYWTPQIEDEQFGDPANVLSIGYNLVARLADGVTEERAAAEVAMILESVKQAGELDNPHFTGGVMPLREYYVGDAKTPLLVLLGAVGLVLLIVCANLANLLLAQAASRASDFAVRLSLGASSGQLVRQLMIESLVLGVAGGIAGLTVGMWAADALIAALPPDLPRMPDMRLDLSVVLFTFGISLLAALVFGMAPALHARRAALASSLREGGRGLAGRSGGRTRSMLVLAETALAFALVIGAGLLIRSFAELRGTSPGFETENALSFQLGLPSTRYDTDERVNSYWVETLRRLEAVPGVTRAGAIQHLPLGGSIMRISFLVDGREPPAPGEEPTLDVRVATPGYFDAMGLPLRAGRTFTDADRAGAPPVALLSESAAARHFPGEDPLGQRIILDWERNDEPVTGVVVGVVGDVRHGELRAAPEPEIYLPQAQVPRLSMAVVVRTEAAPALLSRPVTEAVHEIDPTIAVAHLRPMKEVVAQSVATDRFMTSLLTAFSLIALLLAAIGTFGVISYGVTQRRREIGVRIAIGASRRDVVGMVVGGALRLAGAGVLLGAIGALWLGDLMRSLLFGVQPFDPGTFVGGAIVLLLVSFGASVLPAMGAARTPPATVLNTE